MLYFCLLHEAVDCLGYMAIAMRHHHNIPVESSKELMSAYMNIRYTRTPEIGRECSVGYRLPEGFLVFMFLMRPLSL